jgi:hypothetical protein
VAAPQQVVRLLVPRRARGAADFQAELIARIERHAGGGPSAA